MSCTSTIPILEWTAGQNRDEPLTFYSSGSTPLDLTGATVSLVVMESFSDADPWETFTQDEHEDATAGLTSLAVDLRSVDAAWQTDGKRLVASLWLTDSLGQVHPWGNYIVQINAAAPLPA